MNRKIPQKLRKPRSHADEAGGQDAQSTDDEDNDNEVVVETVLKSSAKDNGVNPAQAEQFLRAQRVEKEAQHLLRVLLRAALLRAAILRLILQRLGLLVRVGLLRDAYTSEASERVATCASL